MVLKNLLLLFLFLVVSECVETTTKSEPKAEPVFQIAQRMLSNIGRFPVAIQQGMSGKTEEIRKIVSSALGGGLIGQLVENPVQAAEKFGFDLDQFGINKTTLENSIGLDNSMLHNNLFGKGDVIFSNQQSTPPPSTEPPALFIDGRQVQPQNEAAVLTAILGEQALASTIPPPQHPGVIRSNGNGPIARPYYDDYDDSGRRGPGMNGPRWGMGQGMRQGMGQGQGMRYGQGMGQGQGMGYRMMNQGPGMGRRRINITPAPVSPAPPQESSPTTTAPNLKDLKAVSDTSEAIIKSVMPFLNTPKLETNDVVEPIEETKEIRRAPTAIRPSPPPMIKQMNAKILSLEQRLNEQQELLQQHKSEEKQLKVQKILETIKFGKTSRLSGLQKQLRYSPETDDDLQLTEHPLSEIEPVECECLAVNLDKLKGKWIQTLSSDALNNRFGKTIEKWFGTTNTTLECNEIQLPGNIFIGKHNQFIVRIIDFDNKVNDIPLCVRHMDKNSQHVLIAESQNCKAATLFVKNPEQFFKTNDTELTAFLRKKIIKDEMDRMELVEHVDSCNT
uniref:Uncharacterized protein n=1 Tax=Panagrolaimus sp. JU765 TaxID=591449 RepID=A0AC34REJ6_9BILA